MLVSSLLNNGRFKAQMSKDGEYAQTLSLIRQIAAFT